MSPRAVGPAVGAALLSLLLVATAQAQESEAEPSASAEERGRAVFDAASCAACHTRPEGGAFLAGGRALASPFGTFYSPNITPHPEHGLGGWSEADFARALHEGRAPDGSAYYPAFPYTSYTGMSDADVADLWAFLQTVEPVAEANRGHDLAFPYSLRLLLEPWRWLYFEPGRFQPDPALGETEARGAYLVRALGHCAECHTPRDRLGGLDRDRDFAGTASGPDGRRVANITPHEEGVGGWTAGDIAYYLETGFTPDFDFAGGAMTDVIEHSTSKLADEDRRAIAAYLKTLAPLPGPQ